MSKGRVGSSVLAALVALSVSFGLTATAHAQPQTERIYQRVAPPENPYEGLQKIVVIEHDGGWNKLWADQVTETLRSSLGYSDGVPEGGPGLRPDVVDFVWDRGPAIPSAEDVKVLGTRHGAQGVVVGRITVDQDTERYTQKRSSSSTDKNGNTVKDEWTVSCQRRKVAVSWEAAFYRSDDGSMHFEERDGLSSSRRDCDERGDDRLDLPSHNEMTEPLVKAGGVRFVSKFVPSWQSFTLEWQWDKATGPAYDAAKAQEWDFAVEEANEVLEDDPYNARAIYLLGLALEVGGRPAEAASVHRFAYQCTKVKSFKKARKRAAGRFDELELLAGYGLQVSPIALDDFAPVIDRARVCEGLAKAGDRTELKGLKNKRIPLLDDDGDVDVILPGGLRVDRIQMKGRLVHVRLPDGHEGWVDKKYVKK